MKTCKVCHIQKSLLEFYTDKGSRDGYRGSCKVCQNALYAEKRAKIRSGVNVKTIAQKECNKCHTVKEAKEFFKDAANGDGLYSICKVCKTQSTRKWREANKSYYNNYMKQKNKEHYSKDRIRRYGLTVDKHNSMVTEQNNLCAICQSPPPNGKPLVIDHDPNSGAVRGLLCYTCNRDISILDKVEHKQKCIDYVEKHKKSI